MEAQLGRLGSRWTLTFRPRDQAVWASPLGRFYDQPFSLRVALVHGDHAVGLPFDPAVTPAATLRQTLGPASLRFEAPQVCFGLDLAVDIVAPFYPQDELTSGIPVFLLDVRVTRSADGGVPLPDSLALEVAFLPRTTGSRACDERAVLFHTVFGPAPDHVQGLAADETGDGQEGTVALWAAGAHEPSADGVFAIPLRREQTAATFMLIGHAPGPVLRVHDVPHAFRYVERFPTVSAVADYVTGHEADLRAKTALFERCITASSLGASAVALISQGWQGYLTNTWWTAPVDGRGASWFSVWEGNCLFHNTLDVEYHNAIALLLLWPDLLRQQLIQWAAAVGDDGQVPHDLGAVFTVQRTQAYPHPMPVEECCNLLLLFFAYWRFTDDWSLVEEHLDVVRRVTTALLAFDEDGDGFHESGTANTIDDAGPAMQFAPKQTYLAIKALAALDGVAAIAEEAGDEPWARTCRERSAAGAATLDARAWEGTGYRVSLLNATDTAMNPWLGAMHDGPLFDAAARSPWTTLGLLYHGLVDAMPAVDLDRVRSDIVTALEACAGPWGSRHSSAEPVKGWISQNLARDIVAAYVGIDLLGEAARYWAFEQAQTTSGPGGAFVDTIGPTFLSYYPRGATAMGLLAAAAGLRLDRSAERLTLSPPRVPGRVPLLPLADWEHGKVPWATFRFVGGHLSVDFTHEDLVRAVGDVNIEIESTLDPAGPTAPISDLS